MRLIEGCVLNPNSPSQQECSPSKNKNKKKNNKNKNKKKNVVLLNNPQIYTILKACFNTNIRKSHLIEVLVS